MALLINNECINCGVCDPECPNGAITPGDSFHVINAELCTECMGYFDEKQCVEICPTGCIVPDPAHQETKEQLLAKKNKITQH